MSRTIEHLMSRAEAVEVFGELVALLEEYAPMWYDEDVHNRAVAALEALHAPPAHS